MAKKKKAKKKKLRKKIKAAVRKQAGPAKAVVVPEQDQPTFDLQKLTLPIADFLTQALSESCRPANQVTAFLKLIYTKKVAAIEEFNARHNAKKKRTKKKKGAKT